MSPKGGLEAPECPGAVDGVQKVFAYPVGLRRASAIWCHGWEPGVAAVMKNIELWATHARFLSFKLRLEFNGRHYWCDDRNRLRKLRRIDSDVELDVIQHIHGLAIGPG